jgi:hypothetical protein
MSNNRLLNEKISSSCNLNFISFFFTQGIEQRDFCELYRREMVDKASDAYVLVWKSYVFPPTPPFLKSIFPHLVIAYESNILDSIIP